jgi:hypothetical protein
MGTIKIFKFDSLTNWVGEIVKVLPTIFNRILKNSLSIPLKGDFSNLHSFPSFVLNLLQIQEIRKDIEIPSKIVSQTYHHRFSDG